ncbi:unnamed protein product [Urochloa humidicola]
MADLVLGLAKTTVEGTVSMARSAMEEEDKLKKRVQRDLLVISDEFEMMHSFLNDAKDYVTDNVTRTLVRQVRNTALDVEDCIEIIVHLDNKPHWWRRMMLPWCMPAAAPGKDLDAAVDNIEQLKARVEGMGHRNLRYNHFGDSGHKLAEQTRQQVVANAMVPNNFVAAADVAKQQGTRMDLVMLINKKDTEESRRWGGGAQGGQALPMLDVEGKHDDYRNEKEKEEEEKEKNGGENEKVEQEVDDVHQLKVISVLGTGSDLEMMSIKKAYDDSETCKSFKCRAWVKLTDPFNPIEFIRNLLAQFYRNYCPEQENTADVLEVMLATDNAQIKEFVRQISQKYLVVLEDMSTLVAWEAVMGYLPDKKNGSCIIVHTRRIGIACSCVGHGYLVSELEKLSADHSIYVLFKEDAPGKVIGEDTAEKKKTACEQWLEKNTLFGRDADLIWLSWLTRRPRPRGPRVVSVWGMSGVGKSFLIQHFYRKKQIEKSERPPHRKSEELPHKFVWVNVSRPFDLRDFSRSLHSELDPAFQCQMISTIKDPIQECREHLQTQEDAGYFIVIDALQSTEEWDSISSTFNFNTSSSKKCIVVIITNEEDVAIYCTKDKNFVWNVKGLEVSHAIKLFDKVVNKKFGWNVNQEAREEIRHRNVQTRDVLVQKCGGLPKVICGVAESLGLVYDIKVKDNLVSKLEARGPLTTTRSLGDVFSWLRSYFHSCPDSLKPCIFYLSVFPVNHTIRRRRLVRRWIAEGYLRDEKERTAEEIGERSFSKLVNLSMIQAPRERVDDRRMPLCQVNGFLREYIVSKLMDENIVFALEGNCKKNIQRTGRHLAIDSSWDRDRNVFETIEVSLLRSLTVFGRWESFIISDRMKLLRVLDLEDVSSGVTNGDVEQMVKQLPRLKYLSLRRCKQITRLPDSLGDLKQLQTLDIRETSVIKLPKSIIKLKKLQYIRAGSTKHHQATEEAEIPPPAAAAAAPPTSKPCATLGSCLSKLSIHRHLDDGSHRGVKVPRGIGKLSSLHTMGVVNISAEGKDAILDELKNLTQLHKLGVSGINRKNSEKVFSDISRLAHLESLSLQMQANEDKDAASCMADISSPVVKLRSLKLYGLVDRLPSGIMQMCLQLPRLEKLDIQMKTLPQQDLDVILTLHYLRILRLRLAEFQDGELRFGWRIAERYGSNVSWFIDFLEITCNSRLQALRFGSRVDVGVLKIRCCGVSSSLQFYGLQRMDELKEVWLSGSYDDALKQRLQSELDKNEKKPVLLLEELSSST